MHDNIRWLVSGYKETVMTEELLKKKALKSQRRREVAAQKREKEKVSRTALVISGSPPVIPFASCTEKDDRSSFA